MSSFKNITTNQPVAPNQCWALEILSIPLAQGGTKTMFVVVDIFSRECLHLGEATQASLSKLGKLLDGLVAERGKPISLFTDSGYPWHDTIPSWSITNAVNWQIASSFPSARGAVEHAIFKLKRDIMWFAWPKHRRNLDPMLQAWRRRYNMSSAMPAKGQVFGQ